MSELEIIARNIKNEFIKSKMTIKDFAEKCGTSFGTIRRLFEAENISFQIIEEIANSLGTNVKELLEPNPQQFYIPEETNERAVIDMQKDHIRAMQEELQEKEDYIDELQKKLDAFELEQDGCFTPHVGNRLVVDGEYTKLYLNGKESDYEIDHYSTGKMEVYVILPVDEMVFHR